MGKASLPKTSINDTLDANRERKKQFGRERNAYSGATGVALNSGSGFNSTTNKIEQVQTLKTAGDTMIGPLAFYPKTSTLSSGIMDASKSTGAYSSRIYVIGQGSSADDLEVILGASHAGQILFFQPIIANITLQSYLKTATAWSSGTSYNVGDVVLYSSQRYTCYVAHTSSGSITPTDATKWHRNNIRLTGADDRVVTTDEIVMLQYDTTDGVWTLVSGGGVSTGAGLADNNVWTGTNQFTGSYVTVTGSFSATGSAITLGNASTDIITFGGKAGSNLDMGHYDIDSLDRLLFSTTGTDNLAASDIGIGTNSADSDYLTYNVPSGYHRFKVNGNLAMSVGPTTNPGLSVENMLWVSGSITATGDVAFNQEVTLGNSSSDDINIVGNVDTDISMSASKKIRAYTSTEIGYFVKNATSAVGSEGTIQIPTKNTGVSNASTANSDFGSEIGCIGLYTLGNPTLVIKYSSTAWQGVIFGSSGNATVFQF